MLVCRAAWWAIFGLQLLMSCVVVVVTPRYPQDVHAGWKLFAATVSLLLVLVGVGYISRQQAYKRYWRGSQILPVGYIHGNVILWACCAGVVLFALAGMLVVGLFSPIAIPVLIAVGFQLVNYPNGWAMKPAGWVTGLLDSASG